MQVLGFTSEEQDTIFRILASVLHLGNVYFHRKQMRHGQEGVEVGSDAEIRWAAHLLQINVDGIIRALTTKTTVRFIHFFIWQVLKFMLVDKNIILCI